MKEIHSFLKKQGVIVQLLATEFLNYRIGDRILSISDMEKKYDVARGTIQNAITFLKSVGAIQLESKGRLGTIIQSMNPELLNEYALSNMIFGTMTLPYSSTYEGLATALYKVFEDRHFRMNLAYIRGSNERINAVENGTFQFAIVSLFAAKKAIEENKQLHIVKKFGKYSYLSEHVLVFSNEEDRTLKSGMRVGIDYSSIDHRLLTKAVTAGVDVTYVNMLGHQILPAIIEGKIDAGVWNLDEIKKKYDVVSNYQVVPITDDVLDMTEAVVISRQDFVLVRNIFNEQHIVNDILSIQKSVVEGTLIPKY